MGRGEERERERESNGVDVERSWVCRRKFSGLQSIKYKRRPQQFQEIRNQVYFVQTDKISALSVLPLFSSRKLGALRPQKPLRLIRDEEVGVSILFLYLTPSCYNVTTESALEWAAV